MRGRTGSSATWWPSGCWVCSDERAQRANQCETRAASAAAAEGGAPVKFAFDAEQLEFRDAARNLMEKECPPSAVRTAWENDTGRVPGLWDKLVDLGLLSTDATEIDTVMVLEETGRACVPEPVVEAWATGMAGATLAL